MTLLILAACLACHSESAEDMQMKFEIPTSKGTKWVYTDETNDELVFEVSKSEQTDKGTQLEIARVTKAGSLHCESLLVSKSGMFRTKSEQTDVMPALCLLKFPILENDKWDISCRVKMIAVKGTAKSRAVKEIVVPAGKFRAVEVTMSLTIGKERQTVTSWYASSVGLIRVVDGDTTLVLKSFTPGR